MNQWVETYLCNFVNGRQNNWSALLPIAEFAHNSWKHEHTQHTPHKLIISINPSVKLTAPDDSIPAASDRLDELSKAQSDAQKSLEKHIKPDFSPRSFQINDKVWLDARNLRAKVPSKKLSPRHYGPFTIMKQVSPVAYQIQLPLSMKIHNVFHVDQLIPFTETQEYGKAYPQPPPELIDGEEEYEVEEILDDRIKPRTRNQKQYYIKWKGYAQSENSWVDEKDLHTSELLEEYLKA